MVSDLTKFGYTIVKSIDANYLTFKTNNIYNFYQGLITSNNQPVFIKEFPINNRQNIEEKWQELTSSEQEESLLKSLDHPRLSKYITTIKTDQAIYIISEFINFPSLAKLRGKFTAAAVKKVALSMLEILIYLQRQKPPIIHGQILPENILIDPEFNAYLINFSFSQIIAPEDSLLLGPQEKLDGVFNITSDLYNLGLICLSLLTGKSFNQVLKLSDKYYVFPVKKTVPSLSELFIMWLTQILAPSQDKRFENAMAASGALRPIPVLGDAVMLNKADTHELNPLKRSVVIVVTATTIAILAGTVWISRGIWIRQHSPQYESNPPSHVFLE